MIPGQIPNGKGHISEKKQDSSSHVGSRRHLNKKLTGELGESPDCSFILCVQVFFIPELKVLSLFILFLLLLASLWLQNASSIQISTVASWI